MTINVTHFIVCLGVSEWLTIDVTPQTDSMFHIRYSWLVRAENLKAFILMF